MALFCGASMQQVRVIGRIPDLRRVTSSRPKWVQERLLHVLPAIDEIMFEFPLVKCGVLCYNIRKNPSSWRQL